MSPQRAERIGRQHRLTSRLDFARVKSQGTALRGAHCMLLVRGCPGEPTRVGFVASRKSVGEAVDRNRARRRLREIVRRRWPRVPSTGYLLMFIAFRSAPIAPHQDLASDVERMLSAAGALAPLEAR
jgi:ribonuclease P protein component